jgi:hypothetical protein
MTGERGTTTDNPADAIDVVEGPIGSARLRDPANSRTMAEDTRPTEGQQGPEATDQTRERQEPGRVGVDWDRTSHDKG